MKSMTDYTLFWFFKNLIPRTFSIHRRRQMHNTEAKKVQI
jgi:hypothetical protein